MDLTAPGATAATRAKPAKTRTVPRGVPAASFVLGGTVLSLVGLTWDVQWHNDVGPDTFFTLPHLLLYSGSAFSGLASLFVVLATTAAQRAGRPVDPLVGGRAVGVFGRTFAAPVGYLISGIGAASFLLYGLWDQWWHGLYGFDAVISSPPHIGLLLSVTITMVGAVMVFAAVRAQRWGAAWTLISLAVLLVFSMVTALGLQQVNAGVVDAVTVGATFLSVLFVVMGARVLDRPGGALGVTVVVALVQAVFWWFSPWASRVYAEAIGLPMRDKVSLVPSLPALVPMCLIAVGLVVEAVFLLARRGNRSMKLSGLVAGGVGGLLVAGLDPLQRAWLYSIGLPPASEVVATAVAGAVFGVAAGFLGVRFGGMLRHLAPVQDDRAVAA
ncbi:hypothetical protein [Umezawaea sp. Da 62-37]|uniref:hypothetical protein n=1 Tax=Umezawaea sp. Da 62-37 TaxID=3075927 RepID=UPI0028F6DBB6|nr:hypothetical protein [Umezawaea sp. Da 62-37]WNV83995.1 hypothetical protein RM788_38410 [Umezawaea sp. Da 62-37]